MSEQFPKLSKKQLKTQEQKRVSSSTKDQASRKQVRKGENPLRILPATEQYADVKCSNSWICKNSACRATISIDDTFCKRCSCCICHLFDDNKDPSLWLECTSESGQGDSCGLTCHIECALQRGKVGVVDLGQLMQLDGSYCCASCGKVSGILGFWKKQLCVAKDARRVDVLCYRIYVSYRLLDGTSRFKELHEFIKEAKSKLETEVGPLNGVSLKMARGIVSRLSIASDVLSLCSIAIEKADEWLATKTSKLPSSSEGSLPAACKFLFEEVTSSSVVIVLIEVSSEDVKGYKLWYCKAREDTYTKEPVSVFPRAQRRILISNLQACTEYSFRIVSYTEASDVGHSEAKCFTKSVEIIQRKSNSVAGHKRKINQDTGGSSGSKEGGYYTGKDIEFDSGFKVRDLGKILRLAWAQQQGCLAGPASAKCCESCTVKPEPVQEERKPSTSRQLDLNVASVPDLNEELTPSSRDEDNGCTLEQTVEADDDATSHDNERRNGLARSHGSGDSQNWNQGKNGDVDSQMEGCPKRGASNNGDSDSTLINGSPIRIRTGGLDENFEYCVKIIRWLECQGLIDKEFRLKLLTWFSLRSTEQERRVVNTFIQTLIDDPSSLAGQLVDTFSEIVSSKRPRNGFCCKLWH
ncbi:VIN3-like protein 1 [Lycium ferocissimum]|uniref:VIN3-like protein 1 n=1 Tax=Lycium ferocissimum TaxID=112874 RepID=UPI002814EC47|nr:VIN3-like protein 1 [Lycium ferocissimum]XP_059318576.1 VIN3-like protein 1 [Lycium ferocissimum]XP_059318577.1 VIN3-like protein 1 [Lycium ferocissimum]XP_059318578.1 VIN3-like protein 1 [Lycium ferocissimum]XP_059318579.1 VIN3-like protein 1 [Lycium ferocissimum]XP_059318580.1 VIN3-like protein 1 [Lycium ferocissimum]